MGKWVVHIAIGVMWTFGFWIGLEAGHDNGAEATMQQAFERGYAVQCVGKTGYHWECGE